MGDRTYSVDANMFLSDGTLAYTATGFAQANSTDGIIDFGGNQNITYNAISIADVASFNPQQARSEAVVVVDVVNVKTSAGNELYKLIALLSNDPSFGPGNVVFGGMFELGAAAALDGINMIGTPAPAAIGGSRYEFAIISEQNNVKYEYLKLYNVISGTAPTITYRAFCSTIMEP